MAAAGALHGGDAFALLSPDGRTGLMCVKAGQLLVLPPEALAWHCDASGQLQAPSVAAVLGTPISSWVPWQQFVGAPPGASPAEALGAAVLWPDGTLLPLAGVLKHMRRRVLTPLPLLPSRHSTAGGGYRDPHAHLIVGDTAAASCGSAVATAAAAAAAAAGAGGGRGGGEKRKQQQGAGAAGAAPKSKQAKKGAHAY
jgi:hypothetical protein